MSSSRNYSLIEPHPHMTSPYVHTARGGAGNIIKTTTSSSKPFSTTTSIPRSSLEHKEPSTFKSGRGGAGNTHYSSERAIFSFDEELLGQMRQQQAMAPVYHVGRGGAGNMVYADSSSALVRRKDAETETASARSTSSAESTGAGAAAKGIKHGLEKGWAKVVGARDG